MVDTPRLFLITPPLAEAEAFAPLLEAAVASVDVACVLIRTAARDAHGAKALIRTLAPIAQRHGAAALAEDPRLAARLDLDGAHVAGNGESLEDAISALKPDRIVGAGGFASRHAAMTAGEAGVDYVMFGGPGAQDTPETVREDVEWWAPVFTVPCVGYAVHPEAAAEIAAAGAEFVALCDGLWDRPEAIAEILQEVVEALARLPETVR